MFGFFPKIVKRDGKIKNAQSYIIYKLLISPAEN